MNINLQISTLFEMDNSKDSVREPFEVDWTTIPIERHVPGRLPSFTGVMSFIVIVVISFILYATVFLAHELSLNMFIWITFLGIFTLGFLVEVRDARSKTFKIYPYQVEGRIGRGTKRTIPFDSRTIIFVDLDYVPKDLKDEDSDDWSAEDVKDRGYKVYGPLGGITFARNGEYVSIDNSDRFKLNDIRYLWDYVPGLIRKRQMILSKSTLHYLEKRMENGQYDSFSVEELSVIEPFPSGPGGYWEEISFDLFIVFLLCNLIIAFFALSQLLGYIVCYILSVISAFIASYFVLRKTKPTFERYNEGQEWMLRRMEKRP